jgi:hypothetical protein
MSKKEMKKVSAHEMELIQGYLLMGVMVLQIFYIISVFVRIKDRDEDWNIKWETLWAFGYVYLCLKLPLLTFKAI